MNGPPVISFLLLFTPGYKACARLYLNGDGIGKDSNVSLFFVLMKGRFDAVLPWPFSHRVTMLLLDQSGQGPHIQEKFSPDPNSSSFQRPRSEMNIATGCPRFISHPELERRKTLYMKENTMFIQIMVEWLDVMSRTSGQFCQGSGCAYFQWFMGSMKAISHLSLMWHNSIVRYYDKIVTFGIMIYYIYYRSRTVIHNGHSYIY